MKHTMKKLLVLVLAMMLALGAVSTAFAANAPTDVEAWLSKTYNAEKGHAFDFVFTATQDTTTEGYNHTPVALTIGNISFTEGETGTTKKVSKLNFADFTQAGVYRYTVKETGVAQSFQDSEHEKLIMSKAEYEVLVYVQQVKNGGIDIGINDNWEGNHGMELESLYSSNDPADYKIVSIVVNQIKNDAGEDVLDGGKVDIGKDPNTNGFKFENTYVYEAGFGPDPEQPDPEYNTNGSLRVSKAVVNQNKAAAEFNFTATFTFPAGTNQSTLGGVKANGNPITLDGGNTYTFKLQDAQNIKFTNMPVGTTFTLVEAGAPNYLGSAKTTIDTQVTNEQAAAYGEDLTVSAKKLSVKSNTVDVTNTFMNTPPMGVMLNMLPYVLMFVIGGAALMMFIVFKNRRNNAEEE